jgi:chromosome segregation ATPase
MNTVLLLTEFQYNFLLALGGLILTGIGTLCVPVIKALWGQWKDSRKEKKAKAEKNREESSEVEIAKIQDEAQTRSELWTEVRFLRKDYNGLSLAYAELQKQNAEQRGEVKFMQLQMENVLKELTKVQSEVKNYESLLKTVQHERDTLSTRVVELENIIKEKDAIILQHEATIAVYKGEKHE